MRPAGPRDFSRQSADSAQAFGRVRDLDLGAGLAQSSSRDKQEQETHGELSQKSPRKKKGDG